MSGAEGVTLYLEMAPVRPQPGTAQPHPGCPAGAIPIFRPRVSSWLCCHGTDEAQTLCFDGR